ncbi:MAG: hypothetical protein P4M15_00595 [Alphaproteobacteria bacterium]|nr:hypothetical protein [Alphaproteobacteria bacterium]
MREDEIYVVSKEWFKSRGFIPIAGQPPNGSDNIPVIEIKDPDQLAKGSKGSYKPDLVFANDAYVVLVECKPAFNMGDKLKLEQIAGSLSRQGAFYDELVSRRMLEKSGLKPSYPTKEEFIKKIRFCMTYAGVPIPMERIASVAFSEEGSGVFTQAETQSFGCLIE